MSENTVAPVAAELTAVESPETETPWYQNPLVIGAAVITTAATVVGVVLARRNGVQVDAHDIIEAVAEATHAD